MRRVDIFKTQLLNSRGRFFTATFTLNRVDNTLITQNLRVNRVISCDHKYVVADIGFWSRHTGNYVDSLTAHFPIDKQGDCLYLAADRSKINMDGVVSV